MDFQSPGNAATSAFSEALLQQGALQRQAMLDDLKKKQVESEISLGQTALQEKRDAAAERIREKERSEVERDVAGLAVGDIPDADLIARAKKHHVPIRTTPDLPAAIPEEFGQTATDTTGGVRFAGSPKQADEAAKLQKINAITQQIAGLDPTSPQFKQLAAQYEMIAGKSLPAGLFGKPGAASKPRVIFDPIKKQYTDLNGQVITDPAMLDGTNVDRAAEPRDTSGRDARADTRLDRAYENAVREVGARMKPVQGHIDAINELGPLLAMQSPEADRLIAPIVIKATIAGQGSGFRMTQGEINQVLGGRSHWESLQAALQQWSLDPQKALALTPAQREDMRNVVKAIRAKAVKTSRAVEDARHKLDEAESPDQIKRLRTEIMSTLDAVDQEDGSTSHSGGSGGGQRFVYDVNGKRVNP